MIATVMQPAATPTGLAAAWNDRADASDTHLPETNVVMSDFATPDHPTFFQFPRQPVDGFRAVMGWLNRKGIPLLPQGPSKVARMGPGFNGARNIQTPPKGIAKVQEFQPATTPAATGDWWEYLR